MTEKRINPKTGKEEIKIQPEGLPAIWIEPGLCDRCEPFKECLGLIEIETSEWHDLEKEINKIKITEATKIKIKKMYNLTKCG